MKQMCIKEEIQALFPQFYIHNIAIDFTSTSDVEFRFEFQVLSKEKEAFSHDAIVAIIEKISYHEDESLIITGFTLFDKDIESYVPVFMLDSDIFYFTEKVGANYVIMTAEIDGDYETRDYVTNL